MHELGHNLNLQHGGGVDINRKPNYLSIMSYRFQTFGIPPTNRVDYSPADLPDLDESSLNEPDGIGDGTDNTRYNCPVPPGGERPGVGMGPIDWNCNNVTTDTDIDVDINGDGGHSVLTGFDDWTNLKYDFQSTGDFEDGEHSFSERVTEIDFPTHLENLPPSGPTCFGVAATIVGNNGNNILNGITGDDVIVGLGGNDVISGNGGNDIICAGDGNDVINPGAGNDKIDGGAGNDTINSGGGSDTITSGPGNDAVNGGFGNDSLDGGLGFDTLNGGPGTDTCVNGEVVTGCESP